MKAICYAKMNGRLDNRRRLEKVAEMKDAVAHTLGTWAMDGEIEEGYVVDDKKAKYFNGEHERYMYFPEADTVNRVRESIICDPAAAEYLNMDKAADFIYNCIDYNAVSVVRNVAFIYDEVELDEDGDVCGYGISKGREELFEKVGYGGDEHALDIGQDLLGALWNDRSTVIINIGEIERRCKENAEYTLNEDDYKREFAELFRTAVIQTVCHEFRHAVLELNDIMTATGLNGEGEYSVLAKDEDAVEKYGVTAAGSIMNDIDGRKYVNDMFNEDRLQEKAAEFANEYFEEHEEDDIEI